MSKISVFKFNINNYNSNDSTNIIHKIIGEYLGTRGFHYEQESNSYRTGNPSQQNFNKNMATAVGTALTSAALTGGTRAVTVRSIDRGFEFQIKGNELLIKAYLIDNMYNSKSYIHSAFNNTNAAPYYYGDLKNNLFKKLKESNIVHVSTEVEKINDGSNKKYLKILLIIFSIMIFLPLLLLLPLILKS